MDMKLLALSADATEKSTQMLVRISGALSSFSDADAAFTAYPTLKSLLPAFAAALKNHTMVVLAIDQARYNAVRAKICAALSLEQACNSRLYGLLSEKTGLSPEEKTKLATVPKDAQLFWSEDGVYTGLAVQKGSQTVLFLPLEEDALSRILKNGVVPYLMQKPLETEKQPQIARKEAERPQELPQSEFSDSITQRTINILRENGAKVAISGTPTAQVIKDLGAQAIDFDDFFTFTPHVEDKGDYNMTDYAALLAKSAKELAGTTFGACISEIGSSDGGAYVCITVADDKTAVVRKLYRDEDETEESFLQDAAEELIELIGEKSSGKGAVGIEVADSGSEKSGALSKKSGKILISVVLVLLAAAVTVGCIFFVREKQRRAAEQETQTPVPSASQSEAVSEMPVVTDTVPLSQFIYNELISGVQETPAEVTTQSAAGVAINTAGTTTAGSEEIPAEMIVNGRTLDAKEAVARMIEAEIDNTYNTEAIKAQAVATYTYLKYRNTNWKITGVTLAEDYSEEVYSAVRSVFGEYLSFDGRPAFTPFFSLSAGRTATATTVYGEAVQFPYLRAADSVADKAQDGYKTELIYSVSDMQALLTAYDSTIVLGEDARDWISVVKHDGAVNTGIGYVQTIRIGDKELSGMDFITKVMAGKNMLSPCFSVTYQAPTNEFILTTYGVGNGVGMSQKGADKMAATGSTYVQILARYYSGTTLTA